MTAAAIRRAAAHEIPEIVSVSVAAYAEYHRDVAGPVFDAYLDDLGRLADHWPDAEVLVAEAGGRIAGAVLFYPDAGSEGLGLPSGWAGFRKLAVRPDLRGRGIGRALTEACIAAARRRGAATVGIHTTPFMAGARAMYEAMGFRRCPEFDLVSADMGLGEGAVTIIAYRLDLDRSAP